MKINPIWRIYIINKELSRNDRPRFIDKTKFFKKKLNENVKALLVYITGLIAEIIFYRV